MRRFPERKSVIHYGDNLKGGSIYTGTVAFFGIIKDWIASVRTVRWWQGTDVLECVMYPPGKSKARVFLRRMGGLFLKRFVYNDWFVSERLKAALPKKYHSPNKNRKDGTEWGEVWAVPGQKLNVTKLEHTTFNVLVYYPEKTKFNSWVYGLDIIDELIQRHPEVSWLFADTKLDMEKVYAITDLYLRPSRWDGMPRMILECQELGIPYYWTEDGKPDIEKISRILKSEVLGKEGSLADAVLAEAPPVTD
jgi:hypothetical protein